MNKRRIIIIVVLFGLVGGALWITWWANREPRLAAATPQEMAKLRARYFPNSPSQPAVVQPLPFSQNVRLAVGSLGMGSDDENRKLGDLLITDLTGAQGLQLVDRQSMDKILSEMCLSLSGLARGKDVIEVGKLLRADWFLLGGSRSNSGLSTLVVRIVDARTGIMRDVRVFAKAKDYISAASELGRFVRESRETAALPKLKSFLAIGAFADVGLNSAMPDLPDRLRGLLTASYASSGVTLLEREHVDALLQEVWLDLAGLAGQAETNSVSPLQSAFWLVDGYYQTAMSNTLSLELIVNVHRAFGGRTSRTFVHNSAESLQLQVKDFVSRTIRDADKSVVVPTLAGELRLQFGLGKELYSVATGVSDPSTLPSPGYRLYGSRGQEPKRRRRNVDEAIRAFQTVLLLDPEHTEARVYLGACYRDETVGRIDEAVAYLREAAASARNDYGAQAARVALARFFEHIDHREAAKWFAEAAKHSDSYAAAGFRSLADFSLAEAVQEETAGAGENQPLTPESRKNLQTLVLRDVQGSLDVIAGKSGIYSTSFGFYKVAEVFGVNKAAAEAAISDLLHGLTNEHPELTLHLLAAAAPYQVHTNSPLIADLRAGLLRFREHPEQVIAPDKLLTQLAGSAYEWCVNSNHYELACELLETKRTVAPRLLDCPFTKEDQVKLACALYLGGRWQEALKAFEDLGTRTVTMPTDGPWGCAFVPFPPGKGAAACRTKLGLPTVLSPDEFEVGKPCMAFASPSAFACSKTGLWVASSGKLFEVGFDLVTNEVIQLPVSPLAAITQLRHSPDRVWIATAGEGLIEYALDTRKVRRFTARTDGLLMDHITALCLGDDVLWIGFGNERSGGLGQIALKTGQVRCFTAALAGNMSAAAAAESRIGPPNRPVFALAAIGDAEVWMLVAGTGLRTYRAPRQEWEIVLPGSGITLNCFALEEQRLIAGMSVAQRSLLLAPETDPGATNRSSLTKVLLTDQEYEEQRKKDPKFHRRVRAGSVGADPARSSVRSRDLRGDTWTVLGEDDKLPTPPGLITLNGSEIWLAGEGYIAVFDRAQNRVRKTCPVAATSVDRLEVGGGYLWAQFDRHLYRVPLESTR